MDFKTDIMTNIDRFLQELDREEQLSSIRTGADPHLAWINHNKGNQRNPAPGRGKERKIRNQNQRFCNNCPRDTCPWTHLSKETFVQGLICPRRLLSKGQFSKQTFVQGDFCPRSRIDEMKVAHLIRIR